MSRKFTLQTLVMTAVFTTSSAFAQFYGGGCSSCAPAQAMASVSSCGCGPTVAAPISCAPMSVAVAPVQSTCYETVPVTTYRREKQTVKVPYYKTSYEDRKVQYYEPVTTKRTVTVPTVSYRTVVENRTVNRDMGRWQTNYHPTKKCAPCQYDPRPGLIGWMNRSMIGMRNSMSPNYRTTRQYVPRMVTCNVPTTRQVAVQGTKQVVVNETKMVARTKTERVAVQKLAYREEQVTVMKPQVAYRTQPMGSSLAYGYGGSSLAYGGFYPNAVVFEDDGEDSTRTALDGEEREFDPINRPRSAFPEDREGFPRRAESGTPARGAGLKRPLPPAEDNGPEFTDPDPFKDFGSNSRPTRSRGDSDFVAVSARKPARRRGWHAIESKTETAKAESGKASTGVAVTRK